MEKITSLFEESKFFIKRFWRQVSGMSLPIIKSCLILLSSFKEDCCEILLLRWQSVFLKITYFHAQKQPPEVFLFYKKGVLRNFAKFTEKHLCQSLFLLKFIRPQAWHRCFPVNFAKFLRTAFLQNTFRRLLLHVLDPEWVENSNGASRNVAASAIISIF